MMKKMMKYKLVRDKYERYGGGGIINSTFKAESDEEAMLKVMENCLYSYEDENGNEYGDDDFVMPKKDYLINAIYQQSGDGADYILLLQNLNTGEVLIEGDDFSEGEEDW